MASDHDEAGARMSPHVADDLPRLLTGEANREETLAAARHLRACPDCQQELVAAVVAHASLSSARRVATPRTVPVADPEVVPEPVPLPDMSAVFAKVRDEAARTGQSYKRRRALLAVAAVAVLGTAGGITLAETVGSSSSGPQATTVPLLPLAPGDASAEVTVTGDRMHVNATSLPKLDGGHQYEVWLVDPAAGQLRPLGYVGGDRTADLTVPGSVMAQYTGVAISVQRNTQVAFSGDVVVRGSYA
jgi:hypothetical protein